MEPESRYSPSVVFPIPQLNSFGRPPNVEPYEESLGELPRPTLPKSGSWLEYPVPRLGQDGECSLYQELEPQKFSLKPFFKGLTSDHLESLYALVFWLKDVTEADWVGVYGVYTGPKEAHHGEKAPFLLKLAYDGKPSRGAFPLTHEFSLKSNNVASLLRKEAICINDVKAHQAQGGAYYECDNLVQSELCYPIFVGSEPVGLIDLEGLRKNQFRERDLWLAHLAGQKLAPLIKGLPWSGQGMRSLLSGGGSDARLMNEGA